MIITGGHTYMAKHKDEVLTSEISQRLNELLTELKMSQSEFGRRLGVTRVAVSMWCRGAQIPSEANLREICRQFNVDYNWLTSGRFEMFLKAPKSKIEIIQREYNLSNEEAAYILTFLQSGESIRKALILFNKQFINNLKELSQGD